MHIDSPIYFSIYRLFVMAVFVLMVVVLATGLLTALWQWVVLAVLVVSVCIFVITNHQLLHIVSSDKLWECLVRTARQNELWQVRIDKMVDYGFCVVLDGTSVEPMTQSVRFVIFKDMLNDDDYRKLRVMARF